MTTTREVWRRGVSWGVATARRFGRHRMPTLAAALAYRGVLALFPFLLLVVGFARAIGLGDLLAALTARAVAGQPPADRGALAAWLGTQVQAPPSGGLLSIGVLTALWSVSAGVRELRQALAVAADAPDRSAASTWRWVAASIAIAPLFVVAAVAAAASLLVTSRAIERVAEWLGLGAAFSGAVAWLRVPIVLAIVTLLLAAAYRLAPGPRLPFRSVLPGAVLAAVTWTVMSLGFSVALSTVLDYGTTYGSYGTAIALLVYLQLSAAVVLVGAEVNALRTSERRTTTGSGSDSQGAALLERGRQRGAHDR